MPDDDAAGDLDVIVPAVRGDEDRLRQVLANLLANARVHTPPGTTVTTSVQACPDGTVELRVTDDGPGIPPDLQPHLFDRFTRGDSARSPGAGSTGLGLAIVDAVVTAHGGQIAVSSSPAGTTFRVVLPAVVP
ncbi:sensor histidine kinase [Cellulomonas sp. ATA003]|uniref:sensor histidine kinase n=1 Tax=Cellulomonas sp. ATA003 TaxID=3073064 RepID=UPI0028733F9C|nr:sensor histidine kinase [Cellulomonas sp. ATA003]WNB85625.1 sensor histidine kinase [Cellulomonas sp. ATA003]